MTTLKYGILTSTLLLSASAASLAATLVVPGGSTVLASWSFEAVTTTNTGTTANAGVADIGSQAVGSSASGVHASATTVYSNPAGNGSAKSFSSNGWAVGDYYQFVVSTTGFTDINLLFGQVGSSTGPKDFRLAYSTNGATFTDFITYTVPASDWSSSTVKTTGVTSVDLSSITALNNAASVTFRLFDNSTVSINNGTVASGGTDRVDDFTISSGPVTFAAAPEPSTAVSLIGGLGLLCGFRRIRDRRSAARL